MAGWKSGVLIFEDNMSSAAESKGAPTGSDRFRLVAVIDVGSTSIRMEVAQIDGGGGIRSLDSLSQSVAVGSDTFTRGHISRASTEECVKVLNNFRAVLDEYGIDPEKSVRAVATSAVREARNRDEFLDRIYIATGIPLEVIEGPEINRLTFLGVQPLLQADRQLGSGRILVVEVGGGSTELLGLEKGGVSFAHSYRIGTYRLSEMMASQPGSAAQRRQVLEAAIAAGVRQCREAVGERTKLSALLLIGGEARFAAREMKEDWDGISPLRLQLDRLRELAEEVLRQGVDSLVLERNLTIEEAQTLGPALQVYVRLADEFALSAVHVCGATLRDGLLKAVAVGNTWTDDFVRQLIYSVREIGRKYRYDEAHSDYVTDCALRLFRAMQAEHRLPYRYEVILTVAAMLHDIGVFINSSGHHKHSKYLIENSEIFGLTQLHLRLAALVARYHRRALPSASHLEYAVLPREERLAVSKLAAILRVAEALDHSHRQAPGAVTVDLRDGRVMLRPSRSGEFGAEGVAVKEKARMFEQLYGRTVLLVGMHGKA
jgi:exopolyphosphatase / guanosine-5'-triphosphate,3'-diphosphate pyrophosphatase